MRRVCPFMPSLTNLRAAHKGPGTPLPGGPVKSRRQPNAEGRLSLLARVILVSSQHQLSAQLHHVTSASLLS
jgi:hypothetical protein